MKQLTTSEPKVTTTITANCWKITNISLNPEDESWSCFWVRGLEKEREILIPVMDGKGGVASYNKEMKKYLENEEQKYAKLAKPWPSDLTNAYERMQDAGHFPQGGSRLIGTL